jgi:urease accessory protein
LETGAVLQWFPEPLMLYRDAALQTETEIELGENSMLAMGEIVCAGRVGRGEAFEFHAYQSRLRVRRDGRLIFVSQTALRPSQFEPKRVGAWGKYTHQGQFLLFMPRINPELLDEVRAILAENPAVWSGASQLESGDIAVSMLGRRAFDLQALMAQLRCISNCHSGGVLATEE